jgi:cell wall-associated NlpC family hydrolase
MTVRARHLAILPLILLAGCGAAAERPASAPQQTAMPPLPKMHPKVVEPAAGVATTQGTHRTHRLATVSADDTSLPKPTGAASAGAIEHGAAPAAVADVHTATALPNGVALPPLEAPESVMNIIRAGNTIARTPYKWGGGHGRWQDNGYDCSGSVSYALNAGGLIPGPATSGQLMHWGAPGRGRWITVYASPTHVFMEVAGIRFDTSGAQTTGSRWQDARRPTGGFVARHPPGL